MRRDTSIEAYREIIDSGKASTQRDRIFLALYQDGGSLTRQELSRRTGVPINAMCGRVYELLSDKIIEELPKRPCNVTGINSHPVKVIIDSGKPEQQKLFG